MYFMVTLLIVYRGSESDVRLILKNQRQTPIRCHNKIILTLLNTNDLYYVVSKLGVKKVQEILTPMK